jgi:hypothetical protein
MIGRYSLLQTLKRIQAVLDSISVCLEAPKLYPNSPKLHQILKEARDLCAILLRAASLSNMSFEDTKKRLSYGSYILHIYPSMPQKYRIRRPAGIQAINKELQLYSNSLEIRRSLVQSGTDCYGMFAKRRIRAFETILYAPNPFSVSLE